MQPKTGFVSFNYHFFQIYPSLGVHHLPGSNPVFGIGKHFFVTENSLKSNGSRVMRKDKRLGESGIKLLQIFDRGGGQVLR